MPIAQRKPCIVDGCGQKTQGKAYCQKHAMEVAKGKRLKVTRSTPSTALMRSLCCDAGCKSGERHEYGEQYCKKCDSPCIWKTA